MRPAAEERQEIDLSILTFDSCYFVLSFVYYISRHYSTLGNSSRVISMSSVMIAYYLGNGEDEQD